jgi:hypothetical protein
MWKKTGMKKDKVIEQRKKGPKKGRGKMDFLQFNPPKD